MKIGDIVKSGLNSELKIGHSLSLSKLPIGSLIHNISIKPNQKAVLIRAAGTFAKLIKKTSKNAKIKLANTHCSCAARISDQPIVENIRCMVFVRRVVVGMSLNRWV